MATLVKEFDLNEYGVTGTNITFLKVYEGFVYFGVREPLNGNDSDKRSLYEEEHLKDLHLSVRKTICKDGQINVLLEFLKSAFCFEFNDKQKGHKFFKELFYYTKVNNKKPKQTSTEPFHTPCKKTFNNLYREFEKEDYSFSKQDASNLKYLIDKLRKKFDEPPEEAEFINLFEHFVRGSKKVSENNKHFDYINSHFSISILNSKFNELWKAIKSEYNESKEAKDYARERTRSIVNNK